MFIHHCSGFSRYVTLDSSILEIKTIVHAILQDHLFLVQLNRCKVTGRCNQGFVKHHNGFFVFVIVLANWWEQDDTTITLKSIVDS